MIETMQKEQTPVDVLNSLKNNWIKREKLMSRKMDWQVRLKQTIEAETLNNIKVSLKKLEKEHDKLMDDVALI